MSYNQPNSTMLSIQTFRADGGFVGVFSLLHQGAGVVSGEITATVWQTRDGVVGEAISYVQQHHPDIAPQVTHVHVDHELDGGIADYQW